MVFLHPTRCYGSQSEADAAFWSGTPPSVTDGKLSVVLYNGSAWTVQQFDVTGSGPVLTSSMAVPASSFPTCDRMEAFNDGQTVGLGIATAMILAYLIRIQAWGTR